MVPFVDSQPDFFKNKFLRPFFLLKFGIFNSQMCNLNRYNLSRQALSVTLQVNQPRVRWFRNDSVIQFPFTS